MTPGELHHWVSPAEMPVHTNGRVSKTHAKRLFAQRAHNGLAAAGGAALVGRHAQLHVPTVLTLLYGQTKPA